MLTSTMSTYLNDQLAGETLGLALARRASAQHDGTRLGTFLKLLSWELEEDRDTLVALMTRLGVRRKRVGAPFARMAQAIGHPTLESLDRRIDDKRDMWIALRSRAGEVGIDVDEQIRRAERQAEALERRAAA